MTTPIRIALDIGELHFLETYRANTCLGVLRYAQTQGAWELYFNDQHYSLLGKYRTLEELPPLGVRGIIMATCNAEKWARVQALGLHGVALCNADPAPGMPAVLTDDEEVGAMAADHFVERGFRHLGFCGSHSVPWDETRWRGFRDRARHHCLEPLHFESRHTNDPGGNLQRAGALEQWLRVSPRPLAVLGADDTHAFQVLDMAKRQGIAIPRELGILGVDNNPLICTATSPTLSSMELDPFGVGYRAAQLLDELLAGGSYPEPVLIPPLAIHVRQSTDILAVDDAMVVAAMTFIRQNLASPIGVDEVARAVAVSRRTLEVRFREVLSTTVGEHIRQQRIAKAKNLLHDRHVSIDQTAHLVGYRTGSHFCSAFRAQTGESPGQWRQKHLGRQAPG